MKRYLLICSGACLLLLANIIIPPSEYSVRGNLDSFIFENADATNTLNMSGSSELNTLIQTVVPRFVLQYANAKNVKPLNPLSAGFIDSLQNVDNRFILQYANSSNNLSLNYPVDLIGDTTAPLITSILIVPKGGGNTMIVTTSEYTTAQLNIGVESGSYSVSMDSTSYNIEHYFTPTNLQPDITYYYQVFVTDRSGNITESSEGTFSIQSGIYLPLVVR